MHNIFWKGIAVGNATIKKEGLYYCIHCKCDLPQKGIFRVVVADTGNAYDLGICVPDGDLYSCVTRIPCKRFCSNALVFTLVSNDKTVGVPIGNGKFFAHLDKLNAARLQYTNGQPEIIIGPIQGPQDNDRSRRYQNR